MVFPDLLRIVNAAVDAWRVVLGEANESLQEDADVEDEAEDSVRGLEVLVARAALVDLDDYEAREEGGDAEEVEERVEEGAGTLLGGGVGGLEDEGCLGYKEEARLQCVSIACLERPRGAM